MNKPLTYPEYTEILESLIENHAVFYKFWRLCRPVFSDSIPTACVVFNKDGKCIEFLINKSFWGKQSLHNKKFVICHECLHVINSHGKRVGSKMSNVANQAMDIVVNESLVKYFDFSRGKFDPNNEYYWLDNSFDKEDNVEPWHSFEYYYNRLLKDGGTDGKKNLINDHSGLGDIPEDSAQEIIDQLSEEEAEMLKNISEDSEKNTRKNDLEAGDEKGSLTQKIEQKRVSPKKKWESVIKRFEKRMSKDETLENHWLVKNRRMYNLNFNILLPSEIEQDFRKTESDKISTWFFMDTSASCWELAPRFFNAAKSLNPEKFDVKYFAFDTQVYQVDMKKKVLNGGGGTSFRCISNFIYNKCKQKPYVWILTDGYGNKTNIPEDQKKKWSWFLTENSSTIHIPQESTIYNLQNFE